MERIKLKTVVIATINGTDILASTEDEGLIPVKPICELFGVASRKQIESLNENPLYRSIGTLRVSVAADGKDREMFCLPYEYCMAWMLGINSANVKPEAREKLLDYQHKCVAIFKEHFSGKYSQIDAGLKKVAKRKARIKFLRDDIQKNPPSDERINELLRLENEDRIESRKPFSDIGKQIKSMISLFTEKEMTGK